MQKILISAFALLFTASLFAQHEPIQPFEELGIKVKVLTLSNGKYQESFPNDTTFRFGSVMFNRVTGEVVTVIENDTLYGEYNLKAEVVSRWLSPDPLAAKYLNLSPYNFVANNPIRYIDPDGREIVDPKGRKVSVSYAKDGSLVFSKNATADIKRIATALAGTETGRKQLSNLTGSDIKVKLSISSETKSRTTADGKTAYTYGETTQGNNNASDNYGKYVDKDGNYAIKEASIVIYEGSIAEGVKDGSGLKHEGLTMEEAVGAVAGHETVHATDKKEINADLKAEQGGKVRPRSQREAKPEQVEDKIISESKNN
jgi:RHS repeat-associated protein